jgi:hypothetical protein
MGAGYCENEQFMGIWHYFYPQQRGVLYLPIHDATTEKILNIQTNNLDHW